MTCHFVTRVLIGRNSFDKRIIKFSRAHVRHMVQSAANMADTKQHFLVQWEDRYMGVISASDIISPIQKHYEEGQIIEARYLKRTFRASICDIHREYKHECHDAPHIICSPLNTISSGSVTLILLKLY